MATMIHDWYETGAHSVQLGMEPDRDDLPKSLWFVRTHSGGSVKLATFLEGNVASLTEDSLQKMWHEGLWTGHAGRDSLAICF